MGARSRPEKEKKKMRKNNREPLYTGGGRVFSVDASFGLLATASASALALFLGSALSCVV